MKTRENINALKNFIRYNYAWPGGYPLFAIMGNGDCLCKHCAKDDYKRILADTRANDRLSGWYVEGVAVNWEDAALTCDQCGNPIESAYGEEE